MAQRFHSTFYSRTQIGYTIKIFDSSFSGSSVEFETGANSVTVVFSGEDSTRINPVSPIHVEFDMKIQNAIHEALITDLITATEGRFTAALYDASDNLLTGGFILNDLISQVNAPYPFSFRVAFIDGVARLKELDYNNNGTAYSGTATIEDHLNNIIGIVNNSLTGTTLTKLTQWEEDSHNGTDLCSLTRFSHELFTTQDDNGNDKFTNSFAVLKEICKTFLARFFYWKGSYHFQQFNKYETYSIYDLTINSQVSGGLWDFLPPLNRVKTLIKYGETINLAKGVNLTQASNTGVISGDFKNGKSYTFKGQLEYKTSFSAAFLTANGVKTHRVKFGIVLGIGSKYLERTETTNDFYQTFPSEDEWVDDDFNNLHYYEFYGEVVTEFNYNFNKVISFNIETPSYPGVDVSTARLQIHNIHILKPDGGFYTSPDIELAWTLYNGYFKEKGVADTITNNYEKIYTASNSITGNSKSITIETRMGDVDVSSSPAKLEVFDGTNWSDSNSWSVDTFSGIPIGQVLANEILAGQTNTLRLLRHTLITPSFSPLNRITYKGLKYLFLKGTWKPERDEVSGEWVELNINRLGVSEGTVVTGDGTTGTDPTDPDTAIDKKDNIGGFLGSVSTETTDTTIKNIGLTLLDIIKKAKADLDLVKDTPITQITVPALLSGVTLNEGDKIKIVHPVTGQTETVTLTGNTGATDTSRYSSGDTTLFIESFAPTVNYPEGSFLVKDDDNSPVQSDSVYKSASVTGSNIDLNFKLPEHNDVDRLLTVIRNGFTAIYDIHYTIQDSPNGVRTRINFNRALSNEYVLVKMKV